MGPLKASAIGRAWIGNILVDFRDRVGNQHARVCMDVITDLL